MEQRVTKLESEMETIKLDLGILKATVATKADLAEAMAETRSSIARVNADTRSVIAEVKADTKTAIAEAKNAIIVWVVGAVFLAQLLPGVLRKLGLQ